MDQQEEGRFKRRTYLVAWKGYSLEGATREPEGHLKNASDTVEQYWAGRAAQRLALLPVLAC